MMQIAAAQRLLGPYHFSHSVSRDAKGEPVDGPWCSGHIVIVGPLRKPFVMDKLEPEWCSHCITIWERVNKKPWPRFCRCDTLWEGLPAAVEGCWIHGTPEGVEWAVNQKAIRIKLLRAEAKKIVAALEETERRLDEEAGTDPARALGA